MGGKGILPFDITKVLKDELWRPPRKRTGDSILYCSSDITDSLRHIQLRAAGAPEKPPELASLIKMETGTLWHGRWEKILSRRGYIAAKEIRISDYLPKGWGGRLDWMIWSIARQAFSITDLKTVEGNSIPWLELRGMKPAHKAQLSVYWHSLNGKVPLLDGVAIAYMPISKINGESIDPIWLVEDPIPKDVIIPELERRYEATMLYLDTLKEEGNESFINPALSDPIEREQKLFKNKNKYELKLVPSDAARWCRFPNEICDCSEQGTTKIGEWREEQRNSWKYFPRKGYEDITPLLVP